MKDKSPSFSRILDPEFASLRILGAEGSQLHKSRALGTANGNSRARIQLNSLHTEKQSFSLPRATQNSRERNTAVASENDLPKSRALAMSVCEMLIG